MDNPVDRMSDEQIAAFSAWIANGDPPPGFSKEEIDKECGEGEANKLYPYAFPKDET